MNKSIKKRVLEAALLCSVLGMPVSIALAQQSDDKKTPPKVVVPPRNDRDKPKSPPDNRNDNRGKRPGN